MLKHALDLEQSKVVFEHCEKHLKQKHCYNNVFEVTTDYTSNFRAGKWRVAYGYTEVMTGLYCRHCFILNEGGEVIDPTIFCQTEQRDRAYYTMFVFEDYDEYLTAIEGENYMPALDKYLREQDRQAQKWAKENGIIFVG